LDSYKVCSFHFDRERPVVGYLARWLVNLDNFSTPRERHRGHWGMHKWVIPCNWKFPAEKFSVTVSVGMKPPIGVQVVYPVVYPASAGTLIQPGKAMHIALGPGNWPTDDTDHHGTRKHSS